MADEDNDDRRGSRDNTGRDLRPNHARNNENAPTGSLGTNQVKAPSLGLGGTSTGRQNTQAGQQTQQSKGQNATQTEDNRPIAIKTGDEAVNRDSEAKGQRLMTEDEIKSKAQNQEADERRPNISQSDYAKAFRQANARTAEMEKSKGHEIE